MENLFTKEEYNEEDNVNKIITKEEHFEPKTEEKASSLVYEYQNKYSLTLPWDNQDAHYYSNASSFTSFNFQQSSLCVQRWLGKPFTIIKENKLLEKESKSGKLNNIDKKDTQIKIFNGRKRVRAIRVSACKNYIGLICSGFSKAISTAKTNGDIVKHMKSLLKTKKLKYESVKNQSDKELYESMKKYIYLSICGKTIKNPKKNKHFKIRNKEELGNLLEPNPEDNEVICFKKEILKDMMNYFFNSSYYDEWLSNGMMSENNRYFFLKNKSKIYNKFQNPASYKPRFNYHEYEVL